MRKERTYRPGSERAIFHGVSRAGSNMTYMEQRGMRIVIAWNCSAVVRNRTKETRKEQINSYTFDGLDIDACHWPMFRPMIITGQARIWHGNQVVHVEQIQLVVSSTRCASRIMAVNNIDLPVARNCHRCLAFHH